MTDALLSKIEKQMNTLSRSDRAIASYVISSYDKAAYMTAQKVGAAVGVCEATVVRFARKFGFDGYPQFRLALQEVTRSRLNSLQRIEVTEKRIGDGEVMSGVMSNDIDMIRRTMEMTDRSQFDQAVEILCGAQHIYVIGTRSAAAVAGFMSYYLSMMFRQVTVIDPSNESEIFERMFHISSDDVAIGISFPRYSRRAVKALNFAYDSGAKCIALTDSERSPIAPYAHCCLFAQSDMASVVDSLVAPFSLVNALLVATALHKPDELNERFQRLERIWEEYDVYEKPES